MAGDPPLDQVVTRTFEAGAARRRSAASTWNAGLFRADNRDDILFVTSEQTGFGYFKNFGETRRQGLELGVRAAVRPRRPSAPATRSSPRRSRARKRVNGESNSTNDARGGRAPGLEGTIEIEPGDRIPLIPRHMFKAFARRADQRRTLSLDIDLVAVSSSYARGNENNRHQPDGTYYLGPGSAPATASSISARAIGSGPWMQIVAQINNLFDRRYYTAAQLGPMGFTEHRRVRRADRCPRSTASSRSRHATFYAPGAPIRMWIGTRFRF